MLPIKSQLRRILFSFLQTGLPVLKKTESKLTTVDLTEIPEINLEFGTESIQTVLSTAPRVEKRTVQLQFQLSIQVNQSPLYNLQDTVDYWLDRTQALLNHGVLIQANGTTYPYTLTFDSCQAQLLDEANKPTAVGILNYELTYQWQATYPHQRLHDLLRIHVETFDLITEIGTDTNAS